MDYWQECGKLVLRIIPWQAIGLLLERFEQACGIWRRFRCSRGCTYGGGTGGNLLVYYVLEQLFGSACGITFWCWIMNWNRSLGNGIAVYKLVWDIALVWSLLMNRRFGLRIWATVWCICVCSASSQGITLGIRRFDVCQRYGNLLRGSMSLIMHYGYCFIWQVVSLWLMAWNRRAFLSLE